MNEYYASPSDLAPGTKARAGDINTIDQSVDAAFDKLPGEMALKTGTVTYAVNKSTVANAYAVDLPAAVKSYVDGLEVKMRPGVDNTGACTLNVNGLGAIAIKRQDGTDAAVGDLVGASPVSLIYSSASNTFRLPPLANAQVNQAAASAKSAADSAAAASQSASSAATSASSANNSAGTASTKASEAATSASNAAGSATTATNKAGEASTSASNAAGSASTASTKATEAAGSASTATTKASEAATSANTATTKAGEATTKASEAATSASNAATSATNASNSAATATTKAAEASASATAAAQSRDGLAAIAKQLHAGSVVDVVLYDTTKDSDGGAWRNRCRHTSWENEALAPGKWLGKVENTAAAIAAGGIAGDYFQAGPTYDGGAFFQITDVAAAGAKQIYRGNTREFPALAAIVAEAGRVVVYDATRPELPMWMVFQANDLVAWSSSAMLSNGLTAIRAVNGMLCVTSSASSGGGLTVIDFCADSAKRYELDSHHVYLTSIMGRNVANGYSNPGMAPGLVAAVGNDVAVTVRSDAPVNQASGLPMPTIAVATPAGLSILKHDGTVISGGEANASWNLLSISFDRWGRVWGTAGDSAYGSLQLFSEAPYTAVASIAMGNVGFPQIGSANWGGNTQWPYVLGLQNSASTLVGPGYGSDQGLTLIAENHAFREKSMVAYITNAYNSGWLCGGIRGAWLADTVAETVRDGAELITNGDFSALANWATTDTGWTVNTTNGKAVFATGGTQWAKVYQAIDTVIGKSYKAKVTIDSITAGSTMNLMAMNTALSTIILQASFSAAGTATIEFVATEARTVIAVQANQSAQDIQVDNLSVKPLLITNGIFNGTTGWGTNNATLQVVSGELEVTNGGVPVAQAFQDILPNLAVGKSYEITFTGRRGTSANAVFLVETQDTTLISHVVNSTSNTIITSYFTVPSGATSVAVRLRADGAGTVYFDNIIVRLAQSDRSVKKKGLAIVGSLSKAPVADGAQLVAYSGFLRENYLEQPYNADLDFGTGDFSFMWWSKGAAVPFSRALEGGTSGAVLGFETLTDGKINPYISGSNGYAGYILSTTQPMQDYNHFVFTRRAGSLEVWLNGVLLDSRANTMNVSQPGAVMRVGQHLTGSNYPGPVALLRASATAPSADQIAQIYRDERALFQAGAKCTIAGDPAQKVNIVAYDDTTDLLYVGTDYAYRSAFKGLVRVESEQVVGGANGPVLALSATGGAVLTGCGTAARYQAPSMLLRDELRRCYEARRAEGRAPRPFWFTGTGALASFTLPIGHGVHAVYKQGLLMREGASNDYTTSFDGYRVTVTFPASVPTDHNICIMGVRNG